MAYRSNDGCFEYIYGLLIWVTIWYYVGTAFRSWLFQSLADRLGYFYWLFYTVSIVGVIYATYFISSGVSNYRKQRKLRTTPCKHGVLGGATLNLCQKCLEEKEQEKRRIERERKEHERKEKIRQKAEKLKIEELKRLTKLRLTKLEYLLKLTPQEFEEAVAAMYKSLGFMVKQTPISNDRGKDLILKKNAIKYLVECKRYALEKNIGRPALQKFFAAIAEEKAQKGFVVTTSQFAKTAVDYAKDNNIEL
ncbi:MAG: restriction endonuclease, partial [Waddliaceae bacterium]